MRVVFARVLVILSGLFTSQLETGPHSPDLKVLHKICHGTEPRMPVCYEGVSSLSCVD